ncbi:DUF3718 domain-containing protein [Shewanella schlegeliana]|uniref:DUF3718 domain-containing protein n=1 Tax=Shewanella schlegeliana TaxID=190308 RepID=A0ABS1T0H6_9GAMM|nr:DUF3718 domain-containing protein [Shewanella schlegeliana]MBL4914287.1 DUF3718 domain-containing protein [Shewanella schlegeliana]MCL1109490.1 DUF3718 domain-containing protein [Shewanella schlegeliana]GIU33565.1 hypothetical protein TUM4433_28200 [Shewanella schlegeliana]
MKKLLPLTAIVLTSITFNASAAMEPNLEKKLIAVCKTALSDNLLLYSRTMQENKINKHRVFPRLVCNGQSFHDFAISNGATKVANKIAPYNSSGSTSITDLAMTDSKDVGYSVIF